LFSYFSCFLSHLHKFGYVVNAVIFGVDFISARVKER